MDLDDIENLFKDIIQLDVVGTTSGTKISILICLQFVVRELHFILTSHCYCFSPLINFVDIKN